MKRTLITLAALAACLDQASAQSSVTLYGTLDLSARYVNNAGSARRLSLAHDGLNANQLGFRGIEDLGDGLRANFTLLAGVNPETGTANAKFWNRRSTVSLSNQLGEIRLGRDYTPSNWNPLLFDPFAPSSIGSSLNVTRLFTGLTTTGPGSVGPVNTYIRADNSIGYFLPDNLGGFYGQAMAAAAEAGSNTNLGRYLGARVGWSGGPVNVAGAYGETRVVGTEAKIRLWNVAASYNIASFKVMAQYNDDRDGRPVRNVRERRTLLGGVYSIGVSEIHASWVRSIANIGPDASLYSIGYVYNLSKRTALYGTGSLIKNAGGSAVGGNFSVAPSPFQTAPPTRGGASRGLEFGLRHFF
ncbi:MAG: porin [Pseudomonadota bacterium]|nr:porin [Pseudomonadota bacterium]